MEDDIPRWEYKETSTNIPTLNDLGKKGWEAYAFNSLENSTMLKRKVTKPKPKDDDYGYGR